MEEHVLFAGGEPRLLCPRDDLLEQFARLGKTWGWICGPPSLSVAATILPASVTQSRLRAARSGARPGSGLWKIEPSQRRTSQTVAGGATR